MGNSGSPRHIHIAKRHSLPDQDGAIFGPNSTDRAVLRHHDHLSIINTDYKLYRRSVTHPKLLQITDTKYLAQLISNFAYFNVAGELCPDLRSKADKLKVCSE